jgi:hypothetical protein
MKNPIVDESTAIYYPIRPEHINTGQHFWNAFGNNETEISAGWIVRLIQRLGGGWRPFGKEQIEQYYNEKGHQGFWFNELLSQEMVVVGSDGLYRVTHEFICKCFCSSPVDLGSQKAL